MRRNVFLDFLVIQFVVIVLVMLIFKVISERQIAATVAGILFVVMPAALTFLEYKRAGLNRRGWFLATLQFWVLFALPILGLRVFNWGVPFDALSFLGIAGPTLHKYSSKSYVVMMAATSWEWYKMSFERQDLVPNLLQKLKSKKAGL